MPISSCRPELPQRLGLPPFHPRWPWWGGDLQTLRDTLRPLRLPPDRGERIEIPLPDGGRLLAFLDPPQPHGAPAGVPRALVVVLHGLGGGSDREGVRRLALHLQSAGFAVLRLNLRGAGPGRSLARGTYAAHCNRDLLPALAVARQIAQGLGAQGRPLFGAGISLGGTVLLNACLEAPVAPGPCLDALVCISSPLDLAACADQFERPRNRFYHRWLLQRLIEQTLADPFGIEPSERLLLTGEQRPRTIRAFDDAITAPRWGHASVADYYAAASPVTSLRAAAAVPPTLLVHAHDDPWVPVAPAQSLAGTASRAEGLEVLITARGGHNGFHGVGDSRTTVLGCWADRLAAAWLADQGGSAGQGRAQP